MAKIEDNKLISILFTITHNLSSATCRKATLDAILEHEAKQDITTDEFFLHFNSFVLALCRIYDNGKDAKSFLSILRNSQGTEKEDQIKNILNDCYVLSGKNYKCTVNHFDILQFMRTNSIAHSLEKTGEKRDFISKNKTTWDKVYGVYNDAMRRHHMLYGLIENAEYNFDSLYESTKQEYSANLKYLRIGEYFLRMKRQARHYKHSTKYLNEIGFDCSDDPETTARILNAWYKFIEDRCTISGN